MKLKDILDDKAKRGFDSWMKSKPTHIITLETNGENE